jgi:hypothetical protein
MAYKRKYQQYKVIVTNGEGVTETTNIHNVDYDTDSYKDMLQAYNLIKAEYKENQNVEISFCGISDNGQIDILFKREGKKQEVKDNKNTEELIMDLNEIIDILKERAGRINLIDVYNKERDVLYHKIENINNISIEEKIRIFDQLHDISNKRRKAKEDEAINKILKTNLSNMNNIVSMINNLNKEFKNLEKAKELGEIKYLTKEVDEIVIKVQYIDKADRILKTQKLKKQYDRVIYDSEKGELVCYNKCHK